MTGRVKNKMNARIRKKIHKRYLPDLAIDVLQDEGWQKRLAALAEGEELALSVADAPESFKALDTVPEKYRLSYIIKRVALTSIPVSQSGWWETSENTVYLTLYPTDFSASCFYMAVDFNQ